MRRSLSIILFSSFFAMSCGVIPGVGDENTEGTEEVNSVKMKCKDAEKQASKEGDMLGLAGICDTWSTLTETGAVTGGDELPGVSVIVEKSEDGSVNPDSLKVDYLNKGVLSYLEDGYKQVSGLFLTQEGPSDAFNEANTVEGVKADPETVAEIKAVHMEGLGTYNSDGLVEPDAPLIEKKEAENAAEEGVGAVEPEQLASDNCEDAFVAMADFGTGMIDESGDPAAAALTISATANTMITNDLFKDCASVEDVIGNLGQIALDSDTANARTIAAGSTVVLLNNADDIDASGNGILADYTEYLVDLAVEESSVDSQGPVGVLIEIGDVVIYNPDEEGASLSLVDEGLTVTTEGYTSVSSDALGNHDIEGTKLVGLMFQIFFGVGAEGEAMATFLEAQIKANSDVSVEEMVKVAAKGYTLQAAYDIALDQQESDLSAFTTEMASNLSKATLAAVGGVDGLGEIAAVAFEENKTTLEAEFVSEDSNLEENADGFVASGGSGALSTLAGSGDIPLCSELRGGDATSGFGPDFEADFGGKPERDQALKFLGVESFYTPFADECASQRFAECISGTGPDHNRYGYILHDVDFEKRRKLQEEHVFGKMIYQFTKLMGELQKSDTYGERIRNEMGVSKEDLERNPNAMAAEILNECRWLVDQQSCGNHNYNDTDMMYLQDSTVPSGPQIGPDFGGPEFEYHHEPVEFTKPEDLCIPDHIARTEELEGAGGDFEDRGPFGWLQHITAELAKIQGFADRFAGVFTGIGAEKIQTEDRDDSGHKDDLSEAVDKLRSDMKGFCLNNPASDGYFDPYSSTAGPKERIANTFCQEPGKNLCDSSWNSVICDTGSSSGWDVCSDDYKEQYMTFSELVACELKKDGWKICDKPENSESTLCASRRMQKEFESHYNDGPTTTGHY